MKKQLLFIAASCLLWAGFSFSDDKNAVEKQRPNILFIPIDDLRPDFETYGNIAIKTPNITRMAQQGVTFTRAYCQRRERCFCG